VKIGADEYFFIQDSDVIAILKWNKNRKF
jgi:hypothetical protein